MAETKENIERQAYLDAMERSRQKSDRAWKQTNAIVTGNAGLQSRASRKNRTLVRQVPPEKLNSGAEESEKALKQAELVSREKARYDAEAAEKARIKAAKTAQEKAKNDAEAAEKVRKQAELVLSEKARYEAEAAEKARIKAAKTAQEKAKNDAEEAEKVLKQAELVLSEKARHEAEAAEKARIKAAKTAQEKAKNDAEEAEKVRRQAELVLSEKARYEAEAAEKARIKAAKTAQEKAKNDAEEAEKVRKQASMIAKEKAKHETEEIWKTLEADKRAEKQHFSLRKHLVQPEALKLVPEAVARRYNVLPIEVKGNILRVVMANANDIIAIEALETICHMRIEPETAGIEEVREAIDLSYHSDTEIAEQIATISLPGQVETTIEEISSDTVADAPIAKVLTVIIDGAIKARASDIHIQPEEDNIRIRYRIDGTLHNTLSLPVAIGIPLISRLKILAKMNIADRQRPQDGQLSVKIKDRPEIDIRVATIPIVNGEMAALRLLDRSKALMTLPQLGFLPEGLDKYQEMLKIPYGMILVTGPTGAGKTTTLYASLNTLDSQGRNIITIEDPVEYRFKDINQIQVNPKAGLTFANGLRSILRLDPNVLLVGEMRDAETAEIAIQSALTGHLVLSTIHANDAIGVIARLLDLGIEPFLIASALIGVVAQRMGRRVCRDCSTLVEAPLLEQAAYAKETGEDRKEFLYGRGCKACSNTGYQGRIGFYEILRISDVLRTMLLRGANAGELRIQALKDGMIPLIKDGMLKVKTGITTPAEVLSNAYSAD